MKNLYRLFLILFSFTGLKVYGQNVSSETDTSTFVVKVELITNLESVVLPPYCGVLAPVLAFQYKVLEVVEGKCDEKTLWIKTMCPREAVENKWIEMNKEYVFKLKRSDFDKVDLWNGNMPKTLYERAPQ